MTYKQYITKKCEDYAKDARVRFIGYNTAFGSRMYGTLGTVPLSQCLETPVAENLMVGLGMGMSLEGFKPVICFERHDFMLLALDAIVNHIDKLPSISGGQFRFPVIIRAIVGSRKPIDPGVQHSQDYAHEFGHMLRNTVMFVPRSQEAFDAAWACVGQEGSGAVIIIEYKDDYEDQLQETY